MGMLGGVEEGTNLFSIIVNLAFGFVGGLMLFLGPQEIIAYGSELAEKLLKLTGYGQQMAVMWAQMTGRPSQVALIRFSTRIQNESPEKAISRLKNFATAALPSILDQLTSTSKVSR